MLLTLFDLFEMFGHEPSLQSSTLVTHLMKVLCRVTAIEEYTCPVN